MMYLSAISTKCNVFKTCVQNWFSNVKSMTVPRQALFDLHWLPVKARKEFKMMTFVYNCSRGNAPAYLMELLSHHIPTRSLRSSDHSSLSYFVPFNTGKRRTFGDRGFRTVGLKLWNTLPIAIRKSETLDLFKKQLKTYYFRSFFKLL